MSLSGWVYRKSHTITHASGGLTNYQTKIRVYRTTGTDSTSTVYVGDKCRADYGDIRFTNASGTELPYWIELDAGTYADFWVELDSVSTTNTIYIYYGNSAATSISNGDTTFLFYDGFESADTSGWTTVYGTGGTIAQNTTTKYHGTGSGQFTTSTSSTDVARRKLLSTSYTGCILEYKVMRPTTSGRVHVANINSYGGGRAGMSYVVMYNGYFAYYVSGFTNVVAFSANTWYKVKLVMAPGATTYSIYINDTLYVSPPLLGGATSIYEVGIGGYDANLSVYFDDIIVRTYASSDVIHETWGTEESLGSPLTGWDYRQSHIINGNVTDYQVKLTLQYGTGESSSDTVYLNTHARSDFGDVRFTDNNGNLLSYWIESYTLAGSATVWVKGTFSGDTTIYVYYGNATAGTTSNGHTTFIFFDDFTGSSIDTTKWAYQHGNVATISSSIVTFAADSLYQSVSTFSNPHILRTKFKAASESSNWYVGMYASSSGDNGYWAKNEGSKHWRTMKNYVSSGLTDVARTVDCSTYKTLEFRHTGTSVKFYNDLSLEQTITTNIPTVSMYISIHANSKTIDMDWVSVRQYNVTDVSHSTWGTEEDISTTSFTIRITPTTGTDPLSVTYNCIIPEGTLNNFTLSYGDGNEYTSASQSTFATSHTYDTPGTYTVWGEGYNEFATHLYYEIPYGVTVSAPAITTYYTFNQTYNTIQFHDETIGDPTEWYWTFGDGSSSYEQHPNHTYYTPGTYQVMLYSSNQYQYDWSSSYVNITQILTPPSAYFSPARLDVINPTLPYTVTFTNLSTPTFGCTYNWTVDGTTIATTSSPTISFSELGIYDIGLTVTNSLGSSTRIYNDSIRLTRKSRTMNEVVGGTDTFSTFGVQVFTESATTTDLSLVHATILPESFTFIQREIPETPGIDEWGIRHLYSTINEWGVRIFNTINSWGHKIMHDGTTIDRTPLRCFNAQEFTEEVTISDLHTFDETATT